MKLTKLYTIIKNRRKEKPYGSYTASLFTQGGDRIAQKVGEEAVEVVIASKNKNKERLISEVADLLFHILILLVSTDISVSEIEEELERRSAKRNISENTV